jgi:hypothetical protein
MPKGDAIGPDQAPRREVRHGFGERFSEAAQELRVSVRTQLGAERKRVRERRDRVR